MLAILIYAFLLPFSTQFKIVAIPEKLTILLIFLLSLFLHSVFLFTCPSRATVSILLAYMPHLCWRVLICASFPYLHAKLWSHTGYYPLNTISRTKLSPAPSDQHPLPQIIKNKPNDLCAQVHEWHPPRSCWIQTPACYSPPPPIQSIRENDMVSISYNSEMVSPSPAFFPHQLL